MCIPGESDATSGRKRQSPYLRELLLARERLSHDVVLSGTGAQPPARHPPQVLLTACLKVE